MCVYVCKIWSLSALGCQHAPSQQVLAPRMQLRQAEFAPARSRVRVTLLAVGEVALSLSSVQHGCFLSSEWQVPRLKLCYAAAPTQTPPPGSTLAGEAEPRGATVKNGPCVGHCEPRAGRRGRRGACSEAGSSPRCDAVPRANAVPPPVRIL